MDSRDLFRKSLIIASHPDDEILWFNSILEKVDATLVCFMGIKSEPNRRSERQMVFSEYPLKNLSHLDIDESETFYGVNWQKPKMTQYGIKISRNKVSDVKYKENYYILKTKLEYILPHYRNVFTHNPWGEYGHPDHIQIYKVVKELENKMNFNLWFTNYYSNISLKLMSECIAQISNPQYISFSTNKYLVDDILGLYKKNKCWTWYPDWKWFKDEAFIKDHSTHIQAHNTCKQLPLNFMMLKVFNAPKTISSKSRYMLERLYGKLGLGSIRR